MSDEVYDSNTDFSQLIGDVETPPDFDPDARSFEQAPPGLHIMEVADFKVVPNKEFTCKVDGVRQTFYLTQLRPQLRVAGGPHDGATANDFLPVPTPGRPIPALYANQWANFIKALGFDLPTGPDGKPKLMPTNFQLQQILKRRAQVKIVTSTDADGRPKLNRQGEPFTEPAFFGYSRVGGNGKAKAPAAAAAAPAPRAPAPVAAPSAADIDL